MPGVMCRRVVEVFGVVRLSPPWSIEIPLLQCHIEVPLLRGCGLLRVSVRGVGVFRVAQSCMRILGWPVRLASAPWVC